MAAISSELRLGISAASSWAWGTSLVVGMEVAQTKGLGAWAIWAMTNTAALALFGLLAPRLKVMRAFDRPVIKAGALLIQLFILVIQMCEFYPELFDKICAREPNAYMAMPYYDTELFRRSKRKDNTDYKAKALDLIKHPERLSYTGAGAVLREVKNLYVQFGAYWNQKNWRDVYQILIAGDPKKRSPRALRTQSVINRNKGNAARGERTASSASPERRRTFDGSIS